MNNFVPVYEYAKKNQVSLQSVYRWIREGKFKKSDIKVEKIITKRIRIAELAKK